MTIETRIRIVGADEAPDLAGPLAELLMDCVAGGASVSFMATLEKPKAEVFWRKVADGVANGDRILLIAESGDRIMGTVQVIIGLPENQPHRADVSKLLVHREFRRLGVGAKLMAEVDKVAAQAGRTLLVLDTATASDGERLYERCGWIRVGVIPGYALKPHGGATDTTFFYKRLAVDGTPGHAKTAFAPRALDAAHALTASVIEPARPADAAAVKALVDGAYSKYIDRMGKPPAPMQANYAELAASGDLYVLRAHGVIAGAILLTQDRDALKVNNLVVGQADQGKGYGRELMLFAERMARSRNLRALTLYTNALMHENIELYQKTGFVISDRVAENGFNRVYFRKQLAS